MAQNQPGSNSGVRDLEVSFSLVEGFLPRCILTFTSYRGNTLQFAPSKVDIRHHEQARSRGLTAQETQLVAGIRQAPTSVSTKTELIRLSSHYAQFGPYPVKGISEQVVTVLRAICNAYVQYGTIRLTFTANWPEMPLSGTLARLDGDDCAEFLAGYRVLKPLG